MANVDAAFGLRPIRYASGAPYNGSCNRYYIPATDGTAVYLGSLVKPAGSADAFGVMSVTGNVATGNTVIGVVVGMEMVTRDSTTYRAASTERYVLVADDPNLLFECQDDGAASATATDVGNVAQLTAFTTGSTVTGLSGTKISFSTRTAAGAGTEDVTLLGIVRSPTNDLSSNAKWLVRLNQHFLVNKTVGA